jgi:hypothetical protein
MTRLNQKVLIAVLVAVVASAAAPAMVWAANGGLMVAGCSETETAVVVRVANTASSTQSGVLMVSAVVDGAPVTATRSVTVDAHGSAYVSVDFGPGVDLVLSSKIVDADNPM